MNKPDFAPVTLRTCLFSFVCSWCGSSQIRDEAGTHELSHAGLIAQTATAFVLQLQSGGDWIRTIGRCGTTNVLRSRGLRIGVQHRQTRENEVN